MLLSRRLLENRAESGSIGVGAFDRNRLVGYAWLSLGPHDDELLLARFVPASRSVSWDYDFFVAPSHRLGIVYARIWDHIFEILSSRGIEWSFSYIAFYNRVSLRSQLNMGAVPVGSFIAAAAGKYQVFLSCHFPLVRLARDNSSRAEFSLVPPRQGDV
jgi:hypothetical protein